MTNKQLTSLLEEKGHSIETINDIQNAIFDSQEVLLNYESKLLIDHQEVEAFYNNISAGIEYLYTNGYISKNESRLLNLFVYVGNMPSKIMINYMLEKVRKTVESYPDVIDNTESIRAINDIEDGMRLIDMKCREYFDHLGTLSKEGQYKRKLIRIQKKRERKE